MMTDQLPATNEMFADALKHQESVVVSIPMSAVPSATLAALQEEAGLLLESRDAGARIHETTHNGEKLITLNLRDFTKIVLNLADRKQRSEHGFEVGMRDDAAVATEKPSPLFTRVCELFGHVGANINGEGDRGPASPIQVDVPCEQPYSEPQAKGLLRKVKEETKGIRLHSFASDVTVDDAGVAAPFGPPPSYHMPMDAFVALAGNRHVLHDLHLGLAGFIPRPVVSAAQREGVTAEQGVDTGMQIGGGAKVVDLAIERLRRQTPSGSGGDQTS